MMTCPLPVEAWINWPSPMYIPTWPMGSTLSEKNTRSPGWRSDLSTGVPSVSVLTARSALELVAVLAVDIVDKP